MELVVSYSNPGGRGAYELQTVLLAAQTARGALSDRPAPRPVRRLSPEEVARIAEDYLAGATVNQLAVCHGVHRVTIAHVLDRADVPRRAVGLSPAAVTEAVRLYAEGWSTARIGDKYGVHAATVQAALRRAGLKIRPPHRHA